MKAARLIGVSLLFVMSLALGSLLHLNVPAARRVVAKRIHRVLARQVKGKLQPPQIVFLGLHGARLRELAVSDPKDGASLLALRDVTIYTGAPTQVLRAWLDRKLIDLPAIEIGEAAVSLRQTNKALDLLTALRSPKKRRPRRTKQRKAKAQVHIGLLKVRRATVDIPQPGDSTLRVKLSNIESELSSHGKHVDFAFRKCELLAASPHTGEIRLNLHGHIKQRAKRKHQQQWLSAKGSVGEQPVTLNLVHKNKTLVASVDLPKLTPAARKALSARLKSAVEFPWPDRAQLRLTGNPKKGVFELEAKLDERSGRTLAQLRGSAGLHPTPWIDAIVAGHDLAIKHPQGTLKIPEVEARLRANRGIKHTATLSWSSRRPTFEGRSLGEELTGRVFLTGPHAHATVQSSSAAWLLRAEVRKGVQDSAGESLHTSWQAAMSLQSPRLRDLPWPPSLKRTLPIAYHLDASVVGEFRNGRLSLASTTTASSAAWRRFRAGFTRLDMRLAGNPKAPQIDATLLGQNVSRAKLSLPRVLISALGTPGSLAIRARAEDSARREIILSSRWRRQQTALSDLALKWKRGTAEIAGRIASVTTAGNAVALRGIALQDSRGGDIKGDLHIVGRELQGKLSAVDLDLGPLSRLLRMEYPLTGKLGVEFEMKGRGASRVGHASMKLKNGGMLLLSGVGAAMRLDVQGNKLRADGKLSLGAPGGAANSPCRRRFLDITLGGKGQLGAGGLLSRKAWQNTSTKGRTKSEVPNLTCLIDVVDLVNPGGEIALSKLGGAATLQLMFSGPVNAFTKTDFSLRTRDMTIAMASEDDELWAADSLNLLLDAKTGPRGNDSLDLRLIPHEAPDSTRLHLHADTKGPWTRALTQLGFSLRPQKTTKPAAITIRGRSFDIEHAQLDWPKKGGWRPHLHFRAVHRRPGGVTIYAEYDGPWGASRASGLRWRSIPPHTKNQILAMLKS